MVFGITLAVVMMSSCAMPQSSLTTMNRDVALNKPFESNLQCGDGELKIVIPPE